MASLEHWNIGLVGLNKVSYSYSSTFRFCFWPISHLSWITPIGETLLLTRLDQEMEMNCPQSSQSFAQLTLGFVPFNLCYSTFRPLSHLEGKFRILAVCVFFHDGENATPPLGPRSTWWALHWNIFARSTWWAKLFRWKWSKNWALGRFPFSSLTINKIRIR